MKRLMGVLVLLMLLLSACAAEDPNLPAYMPSKTDYSAEVDENSPEGLAQRSSQLYKDMVNGDMAPAPGFEALLKLASPESAEAMADYQELFIDEINATKDYLESQEDSVTQYEFAETAYTSENEAYILRIQVQESGKRYYFRQDFKCIDGEWKIAGDNIEDTFRIKHRIFFWYN